MAKPNVTVSAVLVAVVITIAAIIVYQSSRPTMSFSATTRVTARHDSVVIAYEEGNATRADVCVDAGIRAPARPMLPARGKRVLVTGAAGFIGSHVARACAELGMKVVAIDDMSGGFMENVPLDLIESFHEVDVKDADKVEWLFRTHGPFEYVYHLAAYASEGMSHFIRSYNYRNNLVGSIELINSAVRHKKTTCFVFTSSIAAYGAPKPPIREGTPMHPEDPYGISKYATELDLKAAHELFVMDFLIFRPHNVYGPHQNIADKYRNVIGIFMNQILHDKPMTIFGDGSQTRSFSYIDDVAPVIAKGPLVPEARNTEFNIGAEKPSSLNELATEVGIAMGVPNHPIRKLDARMEVQNAEATHSKLKCVFHPGRVVGLRDGLGTTAKWVRDRTRSNPRGFQPVEFDAVELVAKMPRSWVRPSMVELARIEHSAANNSNNRPPAEKKKTPAAAATTKAPQQQQTETQEPKTTTTADTEQEKEKPTASASASTMAKPTFISGDDIGFFVVVYNEPERVLDAMLRGIRSIYSTSPVRLVSDKGPADYSALCRRHKPCAFERTAFQINVDRSRPPFNFTAMEMNDRIIGTVKKFPYDDDEETGKTGTVPVRKMPRYAFLWETDARLLRPVAVPPAVSAEDLASGKIGRYGMYQMWRHPNSFGEAKIKTIRELYPMALAPGVGGWSSTGGTLFDTAPFLKPYDATTGRGGFSRDLFDDDKNKRWRRLLRDAWKEFDSTEDLALMAAAFVVDDITVHESKEYTEPPRVSAVHPECPPCFRKCRGELETRDLTDAEYLASDLRIQQCVLQDCGLKCPSILHGVKKPWVKIEFS